jgi:hypothetical protein
VTGKTLVPPQDNLKREAPDGHEALEELEKQEPLKAQIVLLR